MTTTTKSETLEQRIDRLVLEHQLEERREAEASAAAAEGLWADLCMRIRQDADPEMLMHVWPPTLFQCLEEEKAPENFNQGTEVFQLELRIPGLCPIRRVYEKQGVAWLTRGTNWTVYVFAGEFVRCSETDDALVYAKLRYPDWKARHVPKSDPNF